MNKRQSKRQRDIKTKLMAAICMLLVSSIMMVSTTYAWFTLSTAPEVTGINTAVGANGNLEMALQPLNGNSDLITSDVGDSDDAWVLKNTTWGNLVDVSDNSTYGLNNVMLYPAALNATDGVIAENPLAIPAYGPDGRISQLEYEKTITGVYNPNKKFLEGFTGSLGGVDQTVTKAYGVRAVGVSSDMSDRQLAYRAATTAANTAAAKAKSVASQSLTANGAALADIAIKHATSDTTETYTKTELIPLQTMLNTLLGTDPNAVDGALEYIEEALIQYALAEALNDVSDDTYATTVEAYEGATLATLSTLVGDKMPAVTNVIGKLQTAVTNVTNAKSTIDTLLADTSKTSYAWGDFSDALSKLVNPNLMQINGVPVSELKLDWKYIEGEELPDGTYVAEGETDEDKPGKAGYVYYEADKTPYPNMQRVVDAVLGGGDGLQLIIASGAGVYADIADYCGDYSAAVKLSKVSYGGMSVSNLNAKMTTKTSQKPTHLADAQAAVRSFQAGQGGGSSAAINDYYGYIIDLAFRTNVAGSNLMLQGEAVDRVYSDGTNEATMGHGATMTFTSTDTAFSAAQVKSLMNCIRVVFFDTDDRNIIGYARLDQASAETADNGAITMQLVMYDEEAETPAPAADQTIMALEQNTITELSVMVYLDGATITNADVANGVSSMTGTMNLQFSSSATLTPMDYTALKEGTGDTPATPTYTAEDVTTGTVSTGYAATIKYVSDGTNNKLVAVVTKDSQPVTSGVTVKIGDADASYQTLGSYSGWVVDGGTTKPTEAVNVTVTPTT